MRNSAGYYDQLPSMFDIQDGSHSHSNMGNQQRTKSPIKLP